MKKEIFVLDWLVWQRKAKIIKSWESSDKKNIKNKSENFSVNKKILSTDGKK